MEDQCSDRTLWPQIILHCSLNPSYCTLETCAGGALLSLLWYVCVLVLDTCSIFLLILHLECKPVIPSLCTLIAHDLFSPALTQSGLSILDFHFCHLERRTRLMLTMVFELSENKRDGNREYWVKGSHPVHCALSFSIFTALLLFFVLGNSFWSFLVWTLPMLHSARIGEKSLNWNLKFAGTEKVRVPGVVQQSICTQAFPVHPTASWCLWALIQVSVPLFHFGSTWICLFQCLVFL